MVKTNIYCYNEHMLVGALFSWWYGVGLREQIAKIKKSFVMNNDRFSIGLLLKTLFQPFRQISADDGGKSIDEMVRAGFDKLISRLIGAFVRTFVIFAGLVVTVFLAVINVIRILLWLLAPILPIVGIIILITRLA